MNGLHFKAWRLSMGLTQEQAAAALGVGRRGLQKWEAYEETRELPVYIALACSALAKKLKPWTEQ